MSRINLEDNKIYDCSHEMGTKFGVGRIALGGAMTLDRDSPTMMAIDPNGATRVLTLPAVERGLWFIIINRADAAEDLTISSPVDFAGAANVTTRGTISQNETALVYTDGLTWYVGMMPST